jgi:hypothetical protein
VGGLFEGEEAVYRVIERIVGPLGLRVDESCPYVDARLPDGSRVHVILPPLSLCGPVLTIRKFSFLPYAPHDLVTLGTISPRAIEFLAACVRGRANIMISGGASSGKTTLLNVLASFIGDRERPITNEDAAELRLGKPHAVGLAAHDAGLRAARFQILDADDTVTALTASFGEAAKRHAKQWQDALCAVDGMDSRWWDDPESKADAPNPETLLACLLCERCALRRKCLETALKPDTTFVPSTETSWRHQTWGVWGGTTHRERAKALRTTESAEAAAEQLEAELPSRIQRRIRAWKTNAKSAMTAGLIEPLLRARKEAS